MTHAFDHIAAGAQLPPGVEFAYDGLEIEVGNGEQGTGSR
jgi:hypothetical protein